MYGSPEGIVLAIRWVIAALASLASIFGGGWVVYTVLWPLIWNFYLARFSHGPDYWLILASISFIVICLKYLRSVLSSLLTAGSWLCNQLADGFIFCLGYAWPVIGLPLWFCSGLLQRLINFLRRVDHHAETERLKLIRSQLLAWKLSPVPTTRQSEAPTAPPAPAHGIFQAAFNWVLEPAKVSLIWIPELLAISIGAQESFAFALVIMTTPDPDVSSDIAPTTPIIEVAPPPAEDPIVTPSEIKPVQLADPPLQTVVVAPTILASWQMLLVNYETFLPPDLFLHAHPDLPSFSDGFLESIPKIFIIFIGIEESCRLTHASHRWLKQIAETWHLDLNRYVIVGPRRQNRFRKSATMLARSHLEQFGVPSQFVLYVDDSYALFSNQKRLRQKIAKHWPGPAKIIEAVF